MTITLEHERPPPITGPYVVLDFEYSFSINSVDEIDRLMHNYPSWHPSSHSITERYSWSVIEREFDAFESSVNANAHEASARWRSAVTSRTPGTDQMASRSRNRQLLVRSTRFARSTTRTCGDRCSPKKLGSPPGVERPQAHQKPAPANREAPRAVASCCATSSAVP